MDDPTLIRPVQGGPALPLPSFLNTEARREEFAAAMKDAAKVSAELAVISKILPHPFLRAAGFAIVGFEFDPHLSKYVPSKNLGINAAPAPVGFAEPKAYELRPNWWLPSGVVIHLPAVIDRAKTGIPEQRKEDQAAAARLADQAATSRYISGVTAVQNESETTLRAIVAGQGGFQRSGVIFATSGVPFADLQRAAGDVLAIRQAQANGQLRAGQPVQVITNLVAAGAHLPPGAPVPNGSFSALLIGPYTTIAKASGDDAQGIRRELITERADP